MDQNWESYVQFSLLEDTMRPFKGYLDHDVINYTHFQVLNLQATALAHPGDPEKPKSDQYFQSYDPKHESGSLQKLLCLSGIQPLIETVLALWSMSHWCQSQSEMACSWGGQTSIRKE